MSTKSSNRKTNAGKDRSETKSFLVFLVKLVIFMLVLRIFIVSPFNIPSESMQPRLVVGDYLLVSKWSYGYSQYSLPFQVPGIEGRFLANAPKRGDVVVFKAPPNQREDYIKRVIALEGDIVQVKNGALYLNGDPVRRRKVADFTYNVSANSSCDSDAFSATDDDGIKICRYPQFVETLPNGKSYRILDLDPGLPQDNTAAVIVPKGYMFMMGDNRDRSADSRFPAVEGEGIGLVPEENLVGRALVSVFSTDGSASWLKPWTWFSAARWERIGEGF